jgi:hypothetical protein
VKLIVATLSRLTRDTRFLLTLLDSKAEIVFADLPQVPPGAMGRFFLTQPCFCVETTVLRHGSGHLSDGRCA